MTEKGIRRYLLVNGYSNIADFLREKYGLSNKKTQDLIAPLKEEGSDKIIGAMHEEVVTPKAIAKSLLGLKPEEQQTAPTHLVFGYSPKACQDKVTRKLIFDMAKVIAETNRSVLIYLSYEDDAQRLDLEDELRKVYGKVGDLIRIRPKDRLRKRLPEWNQGVGCTVKYIRTDGERPIRNVENSIIQLKDIKAVTEEFEQQFKEEIEALIQL
jgi:hypothetical protein